MPCLGALGSAQISSLSAGLTTRDVDIFEINEAFASQVSLFPSTALMSLSSPLGCLYPHLPLHLPAGRLLCGEIGDPPGEGEPSGGCCGLGPPAGLHRGTAGHHAAQRTEAPWPEVRILLGIPTEAALAKPGGGGRLGQLWLLPCSCCFVSAGPMGWCPCASALGWALRPCSSTLGTERGRATMAQRRGQERSARPPEPPGASAPPIQNGAGSKTTRMFWGTDSGAERF